VLFKWFIIKRKLEQNYRIKSNRGKSEIIESNQIEEKRNYRIKSNRGKSEIIESNQIEEKAKLENQIK